MPRLVVRPLQQFLRLEVSGGLVLLAATIVALVWANTAGASYEDFWSTEISLRVGDHLFSEDLRHLVNDGLMAIFFFVVGLEVKRELTVGELSDPRGRSAAPVRGDRRDGPAGADLPRGDGRRRRLGRVGHPDGHRRRVRAVRPRRCSARRVPAALVAFLLGVAVIDDIGAILVVAFYYTNGIAAGWLAAGGRPGSC